MGKLNWENWRGGEKMANQLSRRLPTGGPENLQKENRMIDPEATTCEDCQGTGSIMIGNFMDGRELIICPECGGLGYLLPAYPDDDDDGYADYVYDRNRDRIWDEEE